MLYLPFENNRLKLYCSMFNRVLGIQSFIHHRLEGEGAQRGSNSQRQPQFTSLFYWQTCWGTCRSQMAVNNEKNQFWLWVFQKGAPCTFSHISSWGTKRSWTKAQSVCLQPPTHYQLLRTGQYISPPFSVFGIVRAVDWKCCSGFANITY